MARTFNEQRMIDGARMYAQAKKSDPFAFARAMCHIENGIATPFNSQGQEAFYSADPATETRLTADGKEYPVTVYRNVTLP